MFGYKVNTVKTPDVTTRKYWNYVKTVGVTLSGNIPADSLVKLCDIYNKGVTFWKYGCNVGDYGLTNSIL
jgi:hypothetical protein